MDTDDLVESRYGPIQRIFSEFGEERFRELEHLVARDLSQQRGLVIATGGKMLLDSRNAEALSSTGRVVCLVAPPGTIVNRVTRPTSRFRPLLAVEDPVQKIIDLLAERAPLYSAFPTVDTDNVSPQEVVDAILDLVG